MTKVRAAQVYKNKKLFAFWLFYKKILYPAVFFTFIFTLLPSAYQGFSLSRFAIVYFQLSPLVHFVQYGIRLKNELPFYNNLGLESAQLWFYSIAISCMVALILLSLSFL